MDYQNLSVSITHYSTCNFKLGKMQVNGNTASDALRVNFTIVKTQMDPLSPYMTVIYDNQ